MKILQINCVYGNGSTGKIVAALHHELLGRGIDSLVCYGRGSDCNETGVYKTTSEFCGKFNHLLSRITGIMYGGCLLSTHHLISIIEKEQPDVVHLHCINGYFVNIYRLVAWLKDHDVRTVLTLHAEFMYTANCGHAFECDKWKLGCGSCPRVREATESLLWDRTHTSWLRMREAFRGFEQLTVVSVSPWLMSRAKQSPILADKTHITILNGLDRSIFTYIPANGRRDMLGLKDEKVVFHATASFNDAPEHIKGGYYVLKLAERMRDVKFIVAGNYKAGISIPSNVTLLGNISSQAELAELYAMADVTLLTSRRETFSMIVAESLCCGTPVVGFKAGAPEQIALSEYSRFVEHGDLDALEAAVRENLSNRRKDDIANKAKTLYAKSVMAERYLDIYERMI